MRPESAGEKKLETRWENGIYLGVRPESTEIIVGNEKGVVKTRTYTVRPEGQRLQKEEFEGFQGVPWEPIPGRGGIEIKSSIKIQENYGDVELREPEIRAEQIRRLRITKQDLDNYEMTIGCPGCRAKNRGEISANHSEEC